MHVLQIYSSVVFYITTSIIWLVPQVLGFTLFTLGYMHLVFAPYSLLLVTYCPLVALPAFFAEVQLLALLGVLFVEVEVEPWPGALSRVWSMG